jgi:hypothetical protein
MFIGTAYETEMSLWVELNELGDLVASYANTLEYTNHQCANYKQLFIANILLGAAYIKLVTTVDFPDNADPILF